MRVWAVGVLVATIITMAPRIIGFNPKSFPSVNPEDIKFVDCNLGECG